MSNYSIEILDVPAFRVAQAAAAKNDTRYYLNGVFLDNVNGKIVGTDGHIMAVADCIPMTPDIDSRTVKFSKPLPKSAKSATIEVVGEMVQIVYYDSAGRQLMAGEFLDGTFPQYTRALPAMERIQDGKGPARVGFNPRLLERLTKAAGTDGVQIEFGGGDNTYSMRVTFPKLPNLVCALMPMRM